MTYGVGPAEYDVRIAEDMAIEPDEFRLASTIERFTMPNDCPAYVKDKSTWARLGLFVQNTVIECGWSGFLTLELTYHPARRGVNGSYLPRTPINFRRGMPIAQIVFHRLMEPTDSPYAGKYQDQLAGPQPAILEG
jgi:dCTP deaminase